MTAFNQSWDLLKATVYRGATAPYGFRNPDNKLYRNNRGMLSDLPGTGASDPGFLTTNLESAKDYGHYGMEFEDEDTEYLPYVMQFDADIDPDKVFNFNQMSDQELQQVTQALMGTAMPQTNRKGSFDPQDFLKNPNRTIQNTDDTKMILENYLRGLNTPSIHHNPTRWEANLQVYPMISEWGQKIEDAISDLGKYYVGYGDVWNHDTLYSLRQDPSFKMVARHML